MTLVLIGESLLSAVVEVLVDWLASPEVLGFFKTQKLDDSLLQKLKETLNTVSGLLDDAEEKQITKPAVKNWLNDVKHAVYEAEDLMEGIDHEHRQSKEEAASQTVTSQVRRIVPFLNPTTKRMKEMEAELQNIFEKLERLVKHKGDLCKIEGNSGGRPLSEKTSPLVDESHVYGRDVDKEAIVELLRSSEANGSNVGVIPILGMGGVGKTTLVQLIYNDRRVEKWFDLKAWVWVSEEFNVCRVMDDILKKVNAATCGSREPNESLKEALKEKKFLLVLDAVWDIEYSEWDKLRLPLQYAEQGSKIVVTTRNEGVAKVMRTVIPPYHLKGICDEDCWKLFAKHAFSGVNYDSCSQFEEFGRKIVRKCKGLPLAAKTLGGLLHSEENAEEWKKLSKSKMWGLSNENIPPALRLSYYYLPSHLKRCFAYCAIFPKDYVFRKKKLIPLWMAEGFLVQSNGEAGIEEIGDKYFDDLVSRSFFQQSTYHPSCFIMHDLIFDLAEYVSGEFCFKFIGDEESSSSLEAGNSCTFPRRARYLSFSTRYNHVPMIFERIHEVQHLRTLLPLSCWSIAHSRTQIILHDILTILKRLRVLCLSDYNIDQLPNSVGNLKHLRHLDLSFTSIVTLPDKMCTLYNLQTLILEWCQDLIELPTNMSNLVNLQHLNIKGTKLKEMPSKMGKLTKLRKLTDFFLGQQSGSSIKELGKLLHLRKRLRILNLQNVADVQDALKANLKGKKQLQQLMLAWDGNTDDTQHEREVLERLEPSMNVKKLSLIGYGGTKFPDWVGNSSFSNMVYLALRECKNCTFLPPCGQLPSLEELHIEGFDEIVAVGSEFYGTGHLLEKSFKCLKKLTFRKMPKWQEWNTDVDGTFPLLKHLCIEECPQLVVSIPGAPRLTKIHIDDGENSRGVINTNESSTGKWSLYIREYPLLKGMEQMSGLSPSFEIINIHGCNSLKCFQLDFFPQFSTFFSIQSCLNLESLCLREGPLAALRHLRIKNCPSLATFPEGGLAAPNLKSLELEGCNNLKSLPENMHSLLPSLGYLELISVPQVESFPNGGLPSNLEVLRIQGCNNKLMGCSLQSLGSLNHFSFGQDDDVESFPEETLLPSTLSSLEIWDLRNLKSLSYKGLRHLTSLSGLHIWRCPNIEFMSEERLPSSLELLVIGECPLLAKRCERETGEDWPKISHISEIRSHN